MNLNNFNELGGYSNNNNQNYYNTGNRGSGESDEVVSIGTWILIMIVLAIPVVNIIALFVMAFGMGNENIKNFGKASLILAGIGLVLAFLLAACSSF